ncbi:MAG: universal stress protein [Halioglobus sp.]|nr:universal stress protein [Halioglobus sp.]
MQKGKLLIIADMENRCYATPRGLALAASLQQDADVVAFTYAPLKRLKMKGPEQTAIRKRLIRERESAVQARIDKYTRSGQKVGLKAVWAKDIHSWIAKQCAGDKYTAVVKTGNRSESLLHTPTDWRLLRECPVPVMLVCDEKWSDTQPVLATLDLSTSVASKRRLNHKVLGNALWLSQALGVELQVVSAIEVPTLLADLDLVDPGTYAREAREDMEAEIRKLSDLFDLPASVFTCKRGPVEKVITSHAAKIRAQIVVMGTVGRTGVKAALMGNTAENVLRHLKTDVFAIKP